MVTGGLGLGPFPQLGRVTTEALGPLLGPVDHLLVEAFIAAVVTPGRGRRRF